MPQPPPPLTYASLCSLFVSQLTVAIHTILAARALYPSNSFLAAKAFNLPIQQSRHPGVCAWINDAVAAVESELLKGIVRRVVLVIFEASRPLPAEKAQSDTDAATDNPSSDSAAVTNPPSSSPAAQDPNPLPPHRLPSPPPGNRPLERYIWDVSRFPLIPKSEVHTPFIRQDPPPPSTSAAPAEPPTAASRAAARAAALDRAHIDMQEQFRGLLARLSTISARLAPLPPDCTFTLCVELRDDADPPVGHPQAWIPAEAGLQRRVFHGDGEADAGVVEGEGGRRMKTGPELGGAKTVPVRTVDAGEMVFEMWIEEGAAKFAGG